MTLQSTLAPVPERVTFKGRLVTVTPLAPETHGDDLWNCLSGSESDGLWLYLPEGPFSIREAFDDYLDRKASATDAIFYSLINTQTQLAVGLASLMRIDRPNRVIEVGGIHYSKVLQRTAGATEAMYLLARYVFDHLNYRRYEWKCNALNLASRSAAERLGFTFEGVFRQHMMVKGQNRDTAWYSLLDREWPDMKLKMEAWLRSENFDENGRQRKRLGEIVS